MTLIYAVAASEDLKAPQVTAGRPRLPGADIVSPVENGSCYLGDSRRGNPRGRSAVGLARCAHRRADLEELEVAGVHGGAVLQRDDLVVAVEPGMDLPLGGVELGEGRTARQGA